MRVAVLDGAGLVINVIVVDAEESLASIGIDRYRVLGEGEAVDIHSPEGSIDAAGLNG